MWPGTTPEKALNELDERSINDVEADDTGLRVTYQLSLVWDTLGWVYFQSGDTNRAGSFVRAAWILGQDATVGEHLAEICEKQGKSKEAAHLYELAMAAQSSPAVRMIPTGVSVTVPLVPSFDASAHDAWRENVLARYRKLTGKNPSNEIQHLPNGQWTLSPGEELSHMRATKLGKILEKSGSAEFSIVFAPGKVESARFVSGEESLESLTDQMKAAHYLVEFPTGSKAKILRRAELSCTPSAGCIVVLLPPDRGRAAQNVGQD